MGKTLFEKIWDRHVVQTITDGPEQLYIDRLYCHEVTSAQAFDGLRARKTRVFRPDKVFCMPDHNIPTMHQEQEIADPVSRRQVETLKQNAAEFALPYFGIMHEKNGIVHVVGPEQGLTLPGMTVVCGDSHTSTHGAMGCVAFGIGTSEVEMVLASQCILQNRPKTMRITVNGTLNPGVSAKDLALYLMKEMTTGGAAGYFVEYAAPDEVTFAYLENREYAPEGEAWDKALAYWQTLYSDSDAVFDAEKTFDASQVPVMVTYGTNPGMGIAIDGTIPRSGDEDFSRALQYMGFAPGEKMLGKKIDYCFLGACTNGRIEDFRTFAGIVKGRIRHPDVTAWLVPGSWSVYRQIEAEGLDKILQDAGFTLRQPGCSACLAMNEDKVPAGKYAIATSNRNFEGRQGPGARTILASPASVAAAAVTGVVTDPRTLMEK